MEYFCDYEQAKREAEKRGLIECEYGDTGYMSGCQPISYCAWNKTGKREDGWDIEVYYTWKIVRDRLKPAPIDPKWVERTIGGIVEL